MLHFPNMGVRQDVSLITFKFMSSMEIMNIETMCATELQNHCCLGLQGCCKIEFA